MTLDSRALLTPCWRSTLPGPFSEGHVVVRRCFLRKGRRSRGPRRRHGGPLRPAHELDPLGHDLGDRALLAILAFPVARLQPTFHEDLAALVEILPTTLRLLAPHDHGEETRFLALLAPLGRVVAVHG